jgi:hypothetical protein
MAMRREMRSAGANIGLVGEWSRRGGLLRILGRAIKQLGIGMLGLACCWVIDVGQDRSFADFEGMGA